MSVLPDVLEPKLKVVFCGTAVGDHSARVGAYHAGPGNQFWTTLYKVGLTPRKFRPAEFLQLPKLGIGFTDLVKKRSGSDSSIRPEDFDVDGLIVKIEQYRPKVLAFNGKKAGKIFLNRKHVENGRQSKSIGETAIFVLPSTSGAARGFWDIDIWRACASFVADT